MKFLIKPPSSYFGGKAYLVEPMLEIIDMQEHETYIEAFGGMASILLNKARSRNEIYNDKSRENSLVFKCFADKTISGEFVKRLLRTEYSKEAYDKALAEYKEVESLIDKGTAAMQIIRMSFCGLFATGFRGFNEGLEAEYYENWKISLYEIADRMSGVSVWNRDALDIIEEYKFDKNTLIYCDSPYTSEERSDNAQEVYTFDNKCDFQLKYMNSVQDSKCKLIVCGYDNELYNRELSNKRGWKKIHICDKPVYSKTNGLGERRDTVSEYIWINF